MRRLIFIFLLFLGFCLAQQKPERQYSIIQLEFSEEYDVIKVKVPNWLTTSELMEQLRKVLIWPGEQPPTKKTYIYVFKETDQIGARSTTGCVYIPGKGFRWDLRYWHPEMRVTAQPTEDEIEIYNTFVECLLRNGFTFDNQRVRQQIANRYHISVARLDTIYTRVLHWWQTAPRDSTGKVIRK